MPFHVLIVHVHVHVCAHEYNYGAFLSDMEGFGEVTRFFLLEARYVDKKIKLTQYMLLYSAVSGRRQS